MGRMEAMATAYRPATIAQALARVRQGVDPRVALGDFLDDWRRTPSAERAGLITDPIGPAGDDLHVRRWAAFFAATAEKLATDEGLPRPRWAASSQYRLPGPWFLEPALSLRAWLLASTPAAFKARNIFCGDDLFRRA